MKKMNFYFNSFKPLFATALMLLSFVSGINAQVVVQDVTKTNATNCGVNDGIITVNSTGSTNAGGVCYFLRIEKETTANIVGSTGTPGNYVLSGLAPGNYTITGQVFDCVTLEVLDVRVNTITIGVTPDANACIGGSATVPGLNLTAAANCQTRLTAANLLVANCTNIDNAAYTVTIKTLGGTVVATSATGDVLVPASLIGKVFQAEVMKNSNGTKCWGYVKLEDKSAPTIVCPANVTLTCAQATWANNVAGSTLTNSLGQIGELSGPSSTSQSTNLVTGVVNSVTPAANGTLALDGIVTECSKWTQYYTDAIVGSKCTGFTVTRTWWAKDEWGNTSATCTQVITIQAPVAPVIGNLTPTASCTTITDAILADILNGLGPNNLRPSITGAVTCGFELVFKSSMLLAGQCAGNYRVMRFYQLVNTCNGATTDYTQTITVTNTAVPTVTANYDNYTRETGGTYCWLMNGTMQMTSPKYRTIVSNVTTAFANNTVATPIRPLASSTMCGAANIRVQLTGTDNACSPGALTYSSSDSRITISSGGLITNKQGQPFMKTAAGANPTFTVTATNACGFSVNHTFEVVLDDNMTPNTVCKVFTTATVDENGFVRVPLSAFENGSSDNCGIERQMVRRMSNPSGDVCTSRTQTNITEPAFGSNDANCWNDYVDFTCADVLDGNIMVVLRSVDAAGNYSDCMINVEVVDKTKPTCTNQPQINKICTDADLSSYKTLFTTPASFDNCNTKLVRFWDDKELTVSCGRGEVTRSWKFVDCTGDTTNNSVVCTQKVVVAPVLGFTVPKIQDQELACSSIDIEAVKEADRRTIINASNLTTFNGGKTCSAPVVEVEHWLYSSTQYCKIYRIRYTIIDHCDPFYDYLNAPIIAGTNCGIMYDPRTGAPYFYGTPDGNCANIQSVPAGFDLFGRATPGHIVIYERLIKINDRTAPVSTLPTAPDKCTTWNGSAQVVNTGCTFGYRTILTGDDNCGTTTAASDPSKLYFMWRAVVKNVPGMTAGTQLGAGNGATASAMASSTVSLTNLAFGTYTICYRVTDLCGNMSQEYCYDIEGADCKAPEILVHTKVVELAGVVINGASTGMARLNYDDIKNRITDNCSGDLTNDAKVTLRKGNTNTAAPTGSEVGTKSVMYGCAEAGTTQSLQVWAVDAAGNWNYVVTTITVQDNIGICTPPIAIFGAARTENNAVVNNVTVSASANGTAVASTSVANGTFNITMQAASNVQVRAAKNNNDDATSGVTTFDIAKVSQHVLDVAKLATPYKMIAADVDKSGEIDANDMLHLRRFILKITPSLPGGNFRFIDKAYTFRDASNPFGEDFPEVVNIASLSANTAANFVAVKLGDVNDSYAALAPRSTRTLSFVTNDMDIVAGNEYTVNIAADKMDAAAFQGTFSFNGAKVKSVKAGDLNNMTDGNFGIFASAVTTSWNGKTQDASEVLAITFVANKSGKLSEMLTVNSELTQAVANDAAGNEMNVNLKFNTGKVAGGEFALYQNQPNPVANETTIGFNLPKDGQARLTITAVDGKVAKVINGNYKAGYNTITVNKSDLNASGVFYYRLETADHSASKKMVIIE